MICIDDQCAISAQCNNPPDYECGWRLIGGWTTELCMRGVSYAVCEQGNWIEHCVDAGEESCEGGFDALGMCPSGKLHCYEDPDTGGPAPGCSNMWGGWAKECETGVYYKQDGCKKEDIDGDGIKDCVPA